MITLESGSPLYNPLLRCPYLTNFPVCILWETVWKVLLQSRYKSSTALPLCTEPVLSPNKTLRLARQNLLWANPSCFFLAIFLPFVFLEMTSRGICPIIFPGTGTRLTCQKIFKTLCLAFLEDGSMFAFFQPPLHHLIVPLSISLAISRHGELFSWIYLEVYCPVFYCVKTVKFLSNM